MIRHVIVRTDIEIYDSGIQVQQYFHFIVGFMCVLRHAGSVLMTIYLTVSSR